MSEPVASSVGHYRLLEPIGTGGFATVHRAVDERLDSEVAIKILAENHALDPDIRERFITEAQLLRRVASPAVIEIHDIGETDRNQPFIVMALADRGDLRNRITEMKEQDGGQHPNVASDDVALVAGVLATALDAVHRAGLVHRDVKPDNMLITSTGSTDHDAVVLRTDERLRLGDLGYAKDLAASSGLTVGGGTHGFNAPEQRQGLTTLDKRADIFGASAVIFWLITGTTPPASDREQRELLLPTVADDALIDALLIGLSSEPAARFDTISEWHEAVTGDITLSPRRSATRRHINGARSTASVAAAIGIGMLFGLVLGVLAMSIVNDDSGSTPSVGTTDDGRTRVQDERGPLQLAVFGDETAVVGETVTFEAAVVGATTFMWIAPDGTSSAGTPTFDVAVTQPGTQNITLVGRTSNGDTLAVDFEFEVEPAE